MDQGGKQNAKQANMKDANKNQGKDVLPDPKDNEDIVVEEGGMGVTNEDIVNALNLLIKNVGFLKADVVLLRKEILTDQKIQRGSSDDVQTRMATLEASFSQLSTTIAATKSQIGVLQTTVKSDNPRKKLTREF